MEPASRGRVATRPDATWLRPSANAKAAKYVSPQPTIMLKAVPSTRLEFRLRRKAARRTTAGDASEELPVGEVSAWAESARRGFESRRSTDGRGSETADLSGAITGVGRTGNALGGGTPGVVERLDFRAKWLRKKVVTCCGADHSNAAATGKGRSKLGVNYTLDANLRSPADAAKILLAAFACTVLVAHNKTSVTSFGRLPEVSSYAGSGSCAYPHELKL